MDFEGFVVPVYEQWEESAHSVDRKVFPQSTCFDSSAQNDVQSDSDDSNHQKKHTITRLIRKKYDPIVDGNKTIRYEDDPEAYKKARKKIQNRLSANRVRGKKKTDQQLFQTQIIEVKKRNQQLTLINSKLQGENIILKQRVVFLQKMLLKQQQDKISSYINTSQKSTSGNSSPLHEPDSLDYDSPFQDTSSWFRSPSSIGGFGKSSAYILVMTLILAVVILPSQQSQSAILATKIQGFQSNAELNQVINTLYNNTLLIQRLKYWGKLLFICIYLAIVSLFVYKKRNIFMKRKKVL